MSQELSAEYIQQVLQGISVPPQPQIMVDLQMEQVMPNPDLRTIAKLISHDPGLSGALLKLVNSPFFGLTNRIASIQQAVNLLAAAGKHAIADKSVAISHHDGDLAESARAMARLEGEINKNVDEYNKRPRKKFVGARAQEYRFAQYIEDWRQKVERVGTLNYPDAARGKLYGSLLLSVSIRADGSVDKIGVQRSSGHKVLDEAAVQALFEAVHAQPGYSLGIDLAVDAVAPVAQRDGARDDGLPQFVLADAQHVPEQDVRQVHVAGHARDHDEAQ